MKIRVIFTDFNYTCPVCLKDGKVTVVGLGEYSKTMTINISKEIGHSQTPLIIIFGKDSSIYKLQ